MEMATTIASSASATYKKLTQLEHILLRADTYVGSKEPEQVTTFVPDDGGKMVSKEITYVPAFYKIFDEILVNAADNKVRDASGTDTIKVNIDIEKGEISVWNNGKGIPIQIHDKEGIYIPEMIFGHLLTGSNFDDDDRKVVGGRNGYGAKLTNIYSTSFTVETQDSICGKIYKQTWQDNMSVCGKPVIKDVKGKAADFTKITFKPDFKRLNMEKIDSDTEAILKKRVYDMTGSLRGARIFLNGQRIKIQSFKDYVAMYLGNEMHLSVRDDATAEDGSVDKGRIVYDKAGERWEIAVALSDTGAFQQVSFVNSIATTKGGTHINHVADQIVARLMDLVRKKEKNAQVKPGQIKGQLFLFVNCLIENPTFDSQTKENMTLRPSHYGSTCVISDLFMKRVAKLGIVETTLSMVRDKEQAQLKKTDGQKRSRLTGIVKLDDANDAGSRKAKNCTLFLTEGMSAKTFAVTGIPVIKNGRDLFGAYPLRGKLLNVRDASVKQKLENQEITELKQILGLQEGKEYTTVDSLRYGRVCALVDSDSVSGDTPLLLQHPRNHNISVRAIDSLIDTTAWTRKANKQCASTSWNVWTETGWTRIVQVIKHRVKKRMFRVVTLTGVVDVTEDHSLLSHDSVEISPKECVVGQQLLHSFPDLDHAEPAASEGSGSDSEFTAKYDKILNASHARRQAFFVDRILEGARDGTACYTDGVFAYTVTDKVEAQVMFTVIRSLGLDASLVYDAESYTVRTSKGAPEIKAGSIQQIIDLGVVEADVYDLETENHHFQAGIGNMIVHNTDGKHIKGLILNWLESSYPSLLKIPGFLVDFVSPIVKCTKTGQPDALFYDLRDYEDWKQANSNGNGWSVKYFKGLGTSKAADIKRYFADLDGHLKSFKALTPTDSELLDMAFSKKRAADRKEWLKRYDPKSADFRASSRSGSYSIADFIDKDLIEFSMYDNVRSIASAIDGLKPGQRKILYTAFKAKLTHDVKVAQFAGDVAKLTEYRHGEQSLCETIVGMAQDFVGSNNIALLSPEGAFGTRLQGGKDAASPRYIYTKLKPIARLLFHPDDDSLLDYIVEDGYQIEPTHFVPVLPMILVNGCEGIGTGYSTTVLPHHPLSILKALREKATNQQDTFSALRPYYSGFTGDIHDCGEGKWTFSGIIKKGQTGNTFEVTELPIGTWTETYKGNLEKMIQEELVRDYKEYHTDTTVKFVVKGTEKLDKQLDGTDDTLLKVFKLTTSKHENNMMLFDSRGALRKYDSVGEILNDFYFERIGFYAKRKDALLQQLQEKLLVARNKARFIGEIVSGNLVMSNRQRALIEADLQERSYDKISGSFSYLMNLSLHTLTSEKIEELQTQQESLSKVYDSVAAKSPETMYIEDLDQLERVL